MFQYWIATFRLKAVLKSGSNTWRSSIFLLVFLISYRYAWGRLLGIDNSGRSSFHALQMSCKVSMVMEHKLSASNTDKYNTMYIELFFSRNFYGTSLSWMFFSVILLDNGYLLPLQHSWCKKQSILQFMNLLFNNIFIT